MERTPVLERRLEQAARAGWLYYIGGRTQDEIATTLGVGRINCLVGKTVPDVSRDVQWGTLKENLAESASRMQAAGIMQVFEPLNPNDAPGYFVPTPSLAQTPTSGTFPAAAPL